MWFSSFRSSFEKRCSKKVGGSHKTPFPLSIFYSMLLLLAAFQKAYSLPHTCNLPPQNFFFVGREEILQDIRQFFKTNKMPILAVVGASGFGKSQLAQKYAYQNSHLYDVIWWIDTDQDLIKQMEELAIALNPLLPAKEKIIPSTLSRDSLVYAVKNILRVKKLRYLLIFDNAVTFSQIEPFIPPNHKCSGKDILITSRNANLWSEVRTIGKLERPESTELIKKILPKDTPSDREKLASTLDDYPLGISIAVWFIKAHPTIDIEAYISMYLKQSLCIPKGLAPPSNALLTGYFPEAETPLRISLNAIENESKIALEALLFMSLLNSKNIPKEYIEKWLKNYDSEPGVQNFPTADEIIRLFHDQSLVQVTKQQKKVAPCYFLSLHDLIHDLIRETLSMDDKKKHIDEAVKILLEIFSGSPEDFTRAIMQQPIHLLHAQKLCKNAKAIGYTTPQLLKLKICIFECLMGPLRDYERGKILLEDIEEDIKAGIKLEPYFNALYQMNKGYCKSVFLDLEEAIRCMEEGLSILSIIDENSEERLRAITNLAQYYVLQGKLDKANTFIERGKYIFPSSKSATYKGLFLAIWSLFLEFQGKYEEVLTVIDEGSMSPALYVEYRPILHALLQQRLRSLIKLQRTEEAEVLLKAWETELKNFYQKRRGLAIGAVFYFKGLLLLAQKKKTSDIFKNLTRALDIYGEAFHGDKKHLNQARVYFSLGKAYEAKKEFDKALKEYLCSEEIYSRVLKEKRVEDVSELYMALAMLGVELKNDALSGKYFKAHLEIFGLKHFRTQNIIHYFYSHRLPLPL